LSNLLSAHKGFTTIVFSSLSETFRLLAVAAVLPLLPHGAALLVNVDWREWLGWRSAPQWGIGPDAMLFAAGCVTLAAPVAGVAVASRRVAGCWRGGAGHVLLRLLPAVIAFSGVSALLTLVWSASRPEVFAYVATTHITLAAVALALAGCGALCGTWFREPLDAAGFSVAIAVAAAAGLLVAGAPVAAIPGPVVEWAMAASPLIAITSAARIDIVRTDVLYQISPLAHQRIDYPTWYAACAWNLALAILCFSVMSKLRIRQPEPLISTKMSSNISRKT
jgi:hypothetical protein